MVEAVVVRAVGLRVVRWRQHRHLVAVHTVEPEEHLHLLCYLEGNQKYFISSLTLIYIQFFHVYFEGQESA